MKPTFQYIVIAILAIGLYSCEDPIELDSTFEGEDLVIDAWVDNQNTDQEIRLSFSQDFFDNRLPTTITSADVSIVNGNTRFTFTHQEDGRFVWSPTGTETLGAVGDELRLEVIYDEELYTSTTQIFRVPPIDSISFQFEDTGLGIDEGFYAQAYIRDFVGQGDCYWIKSTFNDTLQSRPSDINLSFDGVFQPGTANDGSTLIFPIRFNINPFDDDGGLLRPLEPGDHFEVEVLSISREAFNFLFTAQEQILNGENGIFSIPLANSPSNIVQERTEEEILGIFNVAASSKAERTFQ